MCRPAASIGVVAGHEHVAFGEECVLYIADVASRWYVTWPLVVAESVRLRALTRGVVVIIITPFPLLGVPR